MNKRSKLREALAVLQSPDGVPRRRKKSTMSAEPNAGISRAPKSSLEGREGEDSEDRRVTLVGNFSLNKLRCA